MNDVGEPCAGERHARFDRGPLATTTNQAGAAGPGPVCGDATRRPGRDLNRNSQSSEPAAYLTVIAKCPLVVASSRRYAPKGRDGVRATHTLRMFVHIAVAHHRREW